MINVGTKFFETALKKPDRPAVVFQNKKISYSKLAERVDAIAGEILSAGLKRNDMIGLYLPRSIDAIASIMAVIKIGATYVPLDISFPEDRVKYMLFNSGVKAVLTNSDLLHKASSFTNNQNFQIINVDDIPHTPTTKSKIAAGEIVYVMYTSGSTGKPKGVMMGHKTLDNLIKWQRQSSDCSNGVTLQYAPISFDVSFQEILSTLSYGGTLVLCDEETRRDPRKLADLIISQKVERIFVPFITLQQLANVEGNHPSCLREVITAGEQLRITPAIRLFFKSLPHCKLINQYGPTETHVVTFYELSGSSENWPDLSPIGKPIPNVQTYIFDHSLNTVPVNEVGELYIGGISLAKRYINDQSRTKSVFIYHPKTKERLYKTGDLVRLLANGDIKFIGRKDYQVKIGGYRVELGEIETLLSKHPAVKECVVDGKKNNLDQMTLVAYVVLKDGYVSRFKHASPYAELIAFLKKKLPEYMIPARFVILDSLPLTPTGKIDRKSLPGSIMERPQLMTPFVPPKIKMEIEIAQIWKETLQLKEVGVNDIFFELGGNSLLAILVQQKLLQQLGVKIEVIDIFQFPTIRSLAKKLEAKRRRNFSQTTNNSAQRYVSSVANKRNNARRRYAR